MPGARTTQPGYPNHNFPASYPDMSKVFCVRIPFQNLKAALAAFWKGIRTQNTAQGNPVNHYKRLPEITPVVADTFFICQVPFLR